MVDIYFDKLYRYPRIQECVNIAVPFRKGALNDISQIAILQNGKQCLIQPEVTARHDDGSVKFLFVRFMADIPANKRTRVVLAVSKDEYEDAMSASRTSTVSTSASFKTLHDGEDVAKNDSLLTTVSVNNIAGNVNNSSGNSLLSVEKLDNGFKVNCKELKYEVTNNSENIFTKLDDGRKIYTADNFEGPVLKDRDGNDYKMSIGEWRIVNQGPVEITLAARAYNIAQSGESKCKSFNENTECYNHNEQNNHNEEKDNTNACKKIEAEIRITAYAGKPWVNVSYRIINTSEEELKIKSLVFYIKNSQESKITDKLAHIDIAAGNDSTGCGDILTDNSNNEGPIFMTRGTGELDMIERKAPVSSIRTMVAASNYKTSFIIGRDGEEVNETIDDSYLVKEANEHYAEVLYGTFMADYTDAYDGFCVTVHQAQQNYPKAIKSCKDGIAVMLVPEGVGEITMQSGMAKEQNFLIHWHSPETRIWEIDNRSLIYQMPDRPYIAPQVFKESGVMLDVFPDKYNEDVEIALMAKADGHSRCYGMLNWGDTVDMGYTVQGRGGGKPVWSNNEYDYPHACALMYARSGVRRFLDYLIVSAKHWMDVDICHYSSNPLRIGGQWEHTAGHCKNGVMVCSHEWVEGLLDYYHLTGDERGYEAAIGIGNNVLKLLETPMYQVPGEANARETGWALRTLTALYVETNDKKWLAKCDWIIDSFKKWEEEYGDWLSPYTDNTAIRVGFMISVAIGSVMRYYRVFPREDIKKMIIHAVDDLVENCYMDNGLFYYKELPSLARNGNNTLLLESLTIAYELTGDASYLKYGLKTFERAINQATGGAVGVKTVIDDAVICKGDSGKGFAQSFIPLAMYYNAISENGMSITV